MLLVEMVGGQLLDPETGGPIDGSALMADPDSRDLPYVFPPDGTREARSPANRILLDRRCGSSARSMLKALLDDSQGLYSNPDERTKRFEALESHGINAAARDAIQDGSLAAFVSARENELRRQENAFLKHFDLAIGDSVERSEEEVDVDEE
jgi:hypothetical protein